MLLLPLLVLGMVSSRAFGHLESEPLCGTTRIDSTRMICCKDIPQEKPAGMPTCCGSQAMDLNTQICCENAINPLPSETAECCGAFVYDLNLFQCVAGQILPNAEHGCPSKFNNYKHICCNGHVFKRDTVTTACCGSLAYDSHTHECCDGVVAAKHHEKHGGCCGKQVFNSDSHICCSGVLQKRGKGISVCCGTNLQDAATQVCCNGRIQDKLDEATPGCCQYNMYSAADHYCCTTTIHKKQKDGFSGCCKDLALNTKHYECAEGHIVRKFAHNFGSCGQLGFNTEQQVCCRGTNADVLQPKQSSHARCCGTNLVDNKHTCCAQGEVRLCGKGCKCSAAGAEANQL